MDERNDVVHGWWRFGIEGQTALVGRASERAPDLRVLHMTQAELTDLLFRLERAVSETTMTSGRVAADRGNPTA